MNGKDIVSDFVETDTALTPGSYAICDCEDSICKQTYGYVLNNDNIIKFIEDVNNGLGASSDLVAYGVKEASGCIKDHVGKHFTDDDGKISVCITVGHAVNFEDLGNYMMINGSAVKDTPFEVADKSSVPIKNGYGYVVRDQFNESGKFS